MKDHLKLMFKGGLIGIANIIPGVSGGTMAVVLGIYEPLIEAIGEIVTNRERRMEYLKFLAKVGAGAVLAILIFSWIMDYLLTHYPNYTYLFFIGLIAGSIPSIYRSHTDMRLTLVSGVSFFLGMCIIVGFSLYSAEHQSGNVTGAVFQLSTGAVILLLIAGVLSGGSMIVPGISGSFMLVLLGQYEVVIRAVKHLEFLPLAILGTGILAGIWSFARMIEILLKTYPRETFYFILGLVVASLYAIFPGFPIGWVDWAISLAVVALGGWLSLRLSD
ncbi:MAG: DUF368 domain-containing protein [Calditrichaeota bacterium]|nr:DUF368 domain-containing protein [Calditrichota bacterium]